MPGDHPNAALIKRFYDALARRDAAAMIACYHPEAEFSDPVFPRLDRAGVAGMWEMLCARGRDLAVVASDIDADDAAGRAHWVATYTFAATGRRIVNRIDARFVFRDGLIREHRDRFDLRHWMHQALGWKGLLLGWLPAAQSRLRADAARALGAWRSRATDAAPPAAR